MEQGANSAAMESSLSEQTHMGYVPPAYSRDAYGAAAEREVVAYAREGFLRESQGFPPPPPHHHRQIDKNTYPPDVHL